MLKPEQVPYAAIEAAVAMRDRGGSMSDIIRTALNAWPGMETDKRFRGRADGSSTLMPRLILPLTENPDEQ